MAMMARVFVALGSNQGDRLGHLHNARCHLGKLPRTRLIRFSSVYETDPVGPVRQQKFLNAAAQLDTALGPHKLLAHLAHIERATGRSPADQRIKWGPRTLDLDILLYDDLVIQGDDLTIPHPLMHERGFVLKPLTDLDPHAMHPLLKKTAGELLKYLHAPPLTTYRNNPANP